MSVLVDAAEIAGVVTVGRQAFDRAIGIEIAEGLLKAAADDDLAKLASGHIGAAIVDDADRLILERRPERSELTIGPAMGRGVAALAAAAALTKRDAEGLFEGLPGIRKQRRRAARQKLQLRQI